MTAVLHPYYLQQMGIARWLLRETPVVERKLVRLSQTVSQCTRCPLHEQRHQTHVAQGPSDSKLMVIGDAPARLSSPKAAHLFDQMIQSIGLTRDDIYCVHLLKCELPNRQEPTAFEITQCSAYLSEQIALVAPTFIWALGPLVAQSLLNITQPLSTWRESLHDYNGIPVLVSYHPAYLLAHPLKKKQAYRDLLRLDTHATTYRKRIHVD